MLNLWLFQIKASMQVGEKLKKLKMVEKVHSVVLYSGKTDRIQNRRQTGLVVFVVRSRPLGWSMPADTGNVAAMESDRISSAEVVISFVPGYVWDIIQC